jgi:phage tail sheath protein FI
MATSALNVPGVYIQEQFAKTAAVLPTGVPAFIGFVAEDAPAPADAPQLDNGYGPVLLNRKSDFPGGASDFLGDAVNGFFDNGGGYCYVVGLRLAATSLPTADPLVAALDAISALGDVDLVAVPDAVALRDGNDDLIEADVLRVQREMIAHCMREGHRVALLDALPGKSAQSLLDDQVGELGLDGTSAVNAALYHPWINTITSDTRVIPPCGHIAGIISRTDAATGVFKAPANVEIQGATDLDADLDVDALGLLNDAGVNCLRSFPGRGIRVFGARTLSRDPAWRYLNVRRLVLTILRWIDLNMTWAAFEPNVPALWARIQRELTTYLIALWRAGALQGAVDSDAFYVRCNADLNPPETREVGQVVTEIGLAPARPAEFIVVTIQLRAGTTDLI